MVYEPAQGQHIAVNFAALHGQFASPENIVTEYTFAYPVHDAVIEWRGTIAKHVIGRTRIGVVNRVVPAERLEQETATLATRLASGPTQALGHLKRLLRDSFERSFDEQLAAEAESFVQCAGTPDFREGIDAFIEKRAPHFRGA